MHWFLFDEQRLVEQAEALAERLAWQPIWDLRVGAQHPVSFEKRDLQPVIHAIARRSRLELRSLGIYGCDSDSLIFTEDDYPVVLGDLSPLWEMLPNLERLFLHGLTLQLGQPKVAKVREAEISVGMLDHDFVEIMSDTAWPSLERLVINLGDPQFTSSEATAEDLIHIVEDLPRLKHLGILGFCPIDDFILWLASSPLLSQLETLSLIETALSDGPAGVLLSHPEIFRKCRLHVDGSDVSVGVREELRTLLGACVSERLDWDDWRGHF